MNFFKLYIGDYQRDTAHLSITEHGAYMLMLQHFYATQKPLPAGKALHRMLRAQDKSERDAVDVVSAQFWRATEEGLVNDRANEEITKAGTQASTNRDTARAREASRKAARTEHESCTNRSTNDTTKVAPRARNHSHSQKPDTKEIHSEPNGSGAGAPPDPGDVIFSLGVPLLMAASVKESNARSMLGLFRKTHSDESVIEALRRCAVEKPLQPVPWLQAALSAKTAGKRKVDALYEGNIAAAKRYMEERQ